MKLSVHRGTVNTSENLCLSCAYGMKVRGHYGLEQTICNRGLFPQTRGIVPEPIAECNGYRNSKVPEPEIYLASAWISLVDKHGDMRFVRFVTMSEKEQEEVNLRR